MPLGIFCLRGSPLDSTTCGIRRPAAFAFSSKRRPPKNLSSGACGFLGFLDRIPSKVNSFYFDITNAMILSMKIYF
jgi:hypothetical protein